MEERRPVGRAEPLRHLHERPRKYLEEWLDLPAHVHHYAYRMSNPPVQRGQSRDEFQHLLTCFEVSEANAVVSDKFGYGVRIAANGDRLIIVWEAHTEYYSYQMWHIPDDKTVPLDFGTIAFPDYRFPLSPLGVRINVLDIIIAPELQVTREQIRELIYGPHVYGSRVFEEDISVVTSFTPDEHLRERYLIYSSSPEALLHHVSKVVEGVVTIENYYHLVLLPFQEFSKAVDRAHEFEQRNLRQRAQVTAELSTSTSKTLQDWVSRLTQDFMEVSRFAESMRYQLSASVPYSAIVQATLEAFKERPLPPFLPLSDYVSGRLSGVADGYQQLLRRIDAMQSDFESIISVIRARVDLMLQDQNLALQDQNLRLLSSVDKTTKSQAILQHTVEGLSVIVITYYLSGLGNYLIKAFHELGWIENAVYGTALFVPFALVISIGVIAVGRKIINKRMASKGLQ